MQEWLKTWGAIFLVTGTCIGGGMLALPIVTAHCGFLWSLVIFVGCWLVMLLSSLLVLEVNSALPENSSFSSMAQQTLGRYGNYLTWLMFLLLLYALLAAYDTAGSSLLSAIFTQLKLSLHLKWCTVLFTLVFGAVVFVGTRSTDYANRLLLMIKFCLFLLAVFLIAPHVRVRLLSGNFSHYLLVFAPIPVVLTAFGSHFIIPSIRTYIGPDPKRLRRIIVIGMLIPLIVYIIWQIVTFGVIPKVGAHSFAMIDNSHDSVATLVLTLVHFLQGPSVQVAINGFLDMAVTTSFLGIGLSLLDFFIDGLKLDHQRYSQRFLAAVCTFTVPLLFAIFFPDGFVLALRFAAVFAAVLVLILPALMSLRLKGKKLTPFYRLGGGYAMRVFILIAGVFVIMVFFAITFSWVPH